jgi:monofunctional biosynthetic peptidoglycan transglycosylase
MNKKSSTVTRRTAGRHARQISSRSWRRRLHLQLARLVLSLLLITTLPVLALRWIDPPITAFMLPDLWSGIDYHWMVREQMSPYAALAVIAAEDQRFAYHHGFDFKAIRQAMADNAAGERLRGASTISQQTAKNLFLWRSRSMLRKALEAWFTFWLELLLPKARILELYLNIAQLGPNIYGVEAASRHYYGKSARRLTQSEAALLAAVLPNPIRMHVERPSAYVSTRQHWIKRQMNQLGLSYLNGL